MILWKCALQIWIKQILRTPILQYLDTHLYVKEVRIFKIYHYMCKDMILYTCINSYTYMCNGNTAVLL